MNAKSAEIFMRLHRPGLDGGESRVAKAVRVAEKDDDLRTAFAKQSEIDDMALASIRSISVPDIVRKRLATIKARPATKQFDWSGVFKQPAFLPVAIAVIVLTWLVWRVVMDRMQNFPGREAVERMVEANDALTGRDFEPVKGTAGNLGDWLILKGLDRYEVPADFASFAIVGGRVLMQDGSAVAQLAVQKSADEEMLFYIFRASDFAVTLAPPERWRIFKEGKWATAVRGNGPNVFVVAFKGEVEDMEKFLSSVKSRK